MTEPCPKCNSLRTTFNQIYGFWRCDDCEQVWAYEDDDPDYDKLEDYAEPEVLKVMVTRQQYEAIGALQAQHPQLGMEHLTPILGTAITGAILSAAHHGREINIFYDPALEDAVGELTPAPTSDNN